MAHLVSMILCSIMNRGINHPLSHCTILSRESHVSLGTASPYKPPQVFGTCISTGMTCHQINLSTGSEITEKEH